MNTIEPQNNETPSAADQLIDLMLGKAVNQAIYVATRLGLPDLLANGSRNVSDLARQTHTHANTLYRLMRALAGFALFVEVEPGCFELSPLAQPLRSDTPDSVRHFVMMLGSDWHTRAWSHLLRSVETGETAFGLAHDTMLFDYLDAHPADFDVFNKAMTELTRVDAEVVKAAYDFSPYRKVVDIGGGHGEMLAAILADYPHLSGMLLEIPTVAQGARERMNSLGLAERIEVVNGSGFEGVPTGGDLYLMKHVIQGWRDSEAVILLRHIRDAILVNGRLLIVETVIPEGNDPHLSKISDLEMLVLTPSGRERTAAEYSELLSKAGFNLMNVLPTQSYLFIMEAVPV